MESVVLGYLPPRVNMSRLVTPKRLFRTKRKREDPLKQPPLDREMKEKTLKRRKKETERFLSFIYSPGVSNECGFKATYMDPNYARPRHLSCLASEDASELFERLQAMNVGFFKDVGHLREAVENLAHSSGVKRAGSWLILKIAIEASETPAGGISYTVTANYINTANESLITFSQELTTEKYKEWIATPKKEEAVQQKQPSFQEVLKSMREPECSPQGIPTCVCGFEVCRAWCPHYKYECKRKEKA